jgi:mono/diheme cytochrome c family protein
MPSRCERTTRLMLLSGSTCILALVATAAIGAQGKTLAQSGVYTSAQAARGQAIYKERCATCHGAELQGAIAPPLVGDGFLTVWGGLLSELAAKVRNTMPADRSAKLTPAQAVDLVAYVLQAGKFPAGKTELTTDDAVLQTIGVVRHEPAGGPPFAPAGGKGTSFPPAGNLAAMMRGMLFPTSNLIFNVQTNDPGVPPPAKPQGAPRDGGFSWVDWGAGIYSGWDLVDYAAIAVAEAAPILLTPGRRCENGRPVPVDNADWIKFSLDMAEAGRAAYRASQTRNQEAVSESTNQLSDSCLNCHRAYRDRPGGRAARCTTGK